LQIALDHQEKSETAGVSVVATRANVIDWVIDGVDAWVQDCVND